MMQFTIGALIGAVLTIQPATALISEAPYFYNSERPLVIAHRGAFGHAPEESMASFIDAYYGGTDFIEMDLQISADQHLILQHDSYLDDTTNIEEYADRFGDKKRKDGHFYVEDFTLAELKMLKRKQRYATRSPYLNDKFEILTLVELIQTVKMLNEDEPRIVNTATTPGLYIELKDYNNYLSEKGWDLAQMLFSTLSNNGLGNISDSKDTMPIIIQSFDFEALEKFATLSDLPLVQLMHSVGTKYDYDALSEVVHGVGPKSTWIMDTPDADLSDFITQMHSLDMAVHPYTYQDDHL